MSNDLTKEQIIAQLQEKGLKFNPTHSKEKLAALLENGPAPTVPEQSSGDKEDILSLLKGIKASMSSFEDRLASIEGKPSNKYKDEAKPEDIERAHEKNKNIDPKIVAIVEETLGTDFGIEVAGYEDRPGYLFTVIVPQRLSGNAMDSRPKIGSDGQYEKDAFGNVIVEPYFPEDKRSRALGSADSYSAVRDHCEKVRANIVAFYQKMSKPLPEFKYKTL